MKNVLHLPPIKLFMCADWHIELFIVKAKHKFYFCQKYINYVKNQINVLKELNWLKSFFNDSFLSLLINEMEGYFLRRGIKITWAHIVSSIGQIIHNIFMSDSVVHLHLHASYRLC